MNPQIIFPTRINCSCRITNIVTKFQYNVQFLSFIYPKREEEPHVLIRDQPHPVNPCPRVGVALSAFVFLLPIGYIVRCILVVFLLFLDEPAFPTLRGREARNTARLLSQKRKKKRPRNSEPRGGGIYQRERDREKAGGPEKGLCWH